MTTLQKVKYYLELHPYEGPALSAETLVQALREYLPSHLIILRFEETNILEEAYIEEKVRELFQEAGRPEELPAFLTYWVQRDDKLLADCLEWQQMIDELTAQSIGLVGSKMAAEVAAKSAEAPPRRAQPSDEEATRLRLMKLFEFYTKREDRTLQTLTFEEMTTHIKKMSLNTWMHFCRDATITSLLGKEEVHQAFRRTTIKMMNFEQFEKALAGLLDRVHPGNPADGWKMLGVYDEASFRDRMVGLGAPPSTGHAPAKPQLRAPVASIFNLPDLRSLHLPAEQLQKPPKKKKKVKSPEEAELESLSLDKLARLKLDVPVEVEEDADDELFLKEYRLDRPPAEELYSTKMKRKKRLQAESKSRGLLQRLDQRIHKYARP